MRRTLSRTLTLLALGSPLPALGHAHMPALDDSDPLTADIRLCNEVVDAALWALGDRDKNRPMRSFAGDDLKAKLQNEVTRHVFTEPQIRSQKFAMAYARGRCNEALQAERDRTAAK